MLAKGKREKDCKETESRLCWARVGEVGKRHERGTASKKEREVEEGKQTRRKEEYRKDYYSRKERKGKSERHKERRNSPRGERD